MRLRLSRLSIGPIDRLPRLVGASVAVGAVIGILLAGFEYLTVELLLEELLERPLWQQATAPVIGLGLAFAILYWIGGRASPSTSDEFIRAYHERHPRMPLRHLPAKLLAGVTTIGFGGAVGLEGPSIYAGSSIGLNVEQRLSRFFRRDEQKLLLSAGAAAGVAAIFKTPATGVIFALEAPYRDDVARRALLPALFASATSYVVFIALVGTEGVFPALGTEQRGLRLIDTAGGALIGLAAGFGGRGYAWFVRRAKAVADEVDWPFRLAAGGAILAGLVILSEAIFDAPLTLGPGTEAVDWLIEDDHSLGIIAVLFLMRMGATLTTVGAGGTGGLFIPLAVQGIILGGFIGQLVGAADTSLYPTLGLAAFLAAGYRAPIAAVMFVAESTGATPYVVPALIAAAVSQLVAGSSSVASYQRGERLGHLERRFTLPLTSALRTDVLSVPPDATASEFVYVHVLGRRERTVPVVDAGRYVGMCALDSLADLDRSEWDATPVADIMRSDLPAARPSWTLRDAVVEMERADANQIAVVDNDGNFVGIVHADDILKLDEILDETGS